MDKFEIKVGDKVIVKIERGYYGGKVYEITTVKSISPKRGDILLENGDKFPNGKYSTCYGQYNYTWHYLLEYNDINIIEMDIYNHTVELKKTIDDFISLYDKGKLKPTVNEMEELREVMVKIYNNHKGEVE